MGAYGWKPQKPDGRDRVYNLEERILHPFELPRTCDLTGQLPAVWSQLQIGTCVPHGSIAAYLAAAHRENEPPSMLSRLFVYYEGRVLEGSDPSQDTGMEVRDAIKVLASKGAPPESDWPYSDQNPGPFQQKPPQAAYADATAHEAVQYRTVRVSGPGAPLRTALASGLPVVFGFNVPASFEDGSWDPATDPLPVPAPGGQFIGGHCVVICGYDFTCTRFPVPVFKVRNSWGTDWGENGHFYMDYRWPASGLAADFWVIEKVK